MPRSVRECFARITCVLRAFGVTRLSRARSQITRAGIVATALLLALPAHADWYSGSIRHIGVGYDGSTVTVALSGWARNSCTCYAAWPTYMCLQRTRASFREEYALLLKAKAEGRVVNVHIDEASCTVMAIYEAD